MAHGFYPLSYNATPFSGVRLYNPNIDTSSFPWVAHTTTPYKEDASAPTNFLYRVNSGNIDNSTVDYPEQCHLYNAAIVHPCFTAGIKGYYSSNTIDAVRRKNATRESTGTLKAWLYEHRKNPYPTKGEKVMLAILTKMTLTQVSTWFANARRRLKKENKGEWGLKDSNDIDEEEIDNVSDFSNYAAQENDRNLSPTSERVHDSNLSTDKNQFDIRNRANNVDNDDLESVQYSNTWRITPDSINRSTNKKIFQVSTRSFAMGSNYIHNIPTCSIRSTCSACNSPRQIPVESAGYSGDETQQDSFIDADDSSNFSNIIKHKKLNQEWNKLNHFSDLSTESNKYSSKICKQTVEKLTEKISCSIQYQSSAQQPCIPQHSSISPISPLFSITSYPRIPQNSSSYPHSSTILHLRIPPNSCSTQQKNSLPLPYHSTSSNSHISKPKIWSVDDMISSSSIN